MMGWIPVFAGMTDDGVNSRFRGNDVEVVLCGSEVSGWSGWCFFVEFPHARELWIPAFAGMTNDGVDSRFRGNDE